eukprot:6890039-Prymnesium_polylepis.1
MSLRQYVRSAGARGARPLRLECTAVSCVSRPASIYRALCAAASMAPQPRVAAALAPAPAAPSSLKLIALGARRDAAAPLLGTLASCGASLEEMELEE